MNYDYSVVFGQINKIDQLFQNFIKKLKFFVDRMIIKKISIGFLLYVLLFLSMNHWVGTFKIRRRPWFDSMTLRVMIQSEPLMRRANWQKFIEFLWNHESTNHFMIQDSKPPGAWLPSIFIILGLKAWSKKVNLWSSEAHVGYWD